MDSTFTTFDFLVFLAGAVWLIKKVTEADRYEKLRVIVLTTIFSGVALYSYNCVWLEAGKSEYDYQEAAQCFTWSEM